MYFNLRIRGDVKRCGVLERFKHAATYLSRALVSKMFVFCVLCFVFRARVLSQPLQSVSHAYSVTPHAYPCSGIAGETTPLVGGVCRRWSP